MIRLPFPAPSPYQRELRLWEPEGKPRACVVISHGMAEHIDRYDRLAGALNQAGFAVIGHNHLGHGPEAPVPGFFAEDKGWSKVVEDLHSVIRWAGDRYPDIPLVLLGHSMGSFLAREHTLQYPQAVDALVICGTGWQPASMCRMARGLASLAKAFGAGEKPSKLLDTISFSRNNQPFLPGRTPFDWLSRDEAEVDKYVADPCCGFVFTASGFYDLFSGLYDLTRLDRLRATPVGLPVLFISGDADPVGMKGEGVKTVAGQFRQAGLSDVTIRLYEGARHELFNEINREEVQRDLIRWLQASLKDRKEQSA